MSVYYGDWDTLLNPSSVDKHIRWLTVVLAIFAEFAFLAAYMAMMFAFPL